MNKPEKMSGIEFWMAGAAIARPTAYPLIQAESCHKAFTLVFDFTQQDKMGMV